MNDGSKPVSGNQEKGGSKSQGKPKGKDALSRIKLALLDQYALKNEKGGGDPYNTTSPGKTQDQWRGNARRI